MEEGFSGLTCSAPSPTTWVAGVSEASGGGGCGASQSVTSTKKPR